MRPFLEIKYSKEIDSHLTCKWFFLVLKTAGSLWIRVMFCKRQNAKSPESKETQNHKWHLYFSSVGGWCHSQKRVFAGTSVFKVRIWYIKIIHWKNFKLNYYIQFLITIILCINLVNATSHFKNLLINLMNYSPLNILNLNGFDLLKS